jgi:choline dehydrogenase
MGVPFVEDINDPQQPTSSLTKLRTTVTADGKRCSAYEAFLPEHFVRSHSNLKICFGAVVQRLEVTSSGDSQQIDGVYVETEESSRDTFYVKAKEIILCAGAVASPQLLLLR